jgi:hypothetical protein
MMEKQPAIPESLTVVGTSPLSLRRHSWSGQTELEWVLEDITLHETHAEIARGDIDGLLGEMSGKRVLNTKEYKNHLRSVLKRNFNEADEAARLRAKRRRLEEDLSLVTPLNVEMRERLPIYFWNSTSVTTKERP